MLVQTYNMLKCQKHPAFLSRLRWFLPNSTLFSCGKFFGAVFVFGIILLYISDCLISDILSQSYVAPMSPRPAGHNIWFVGAGPGSPLFEGGWFIVWVPEWYSYRMMLEESTILFATSPRKWTNTKIRYSNIEKESLALLLTLQKYTYYPLSSL